MWLRIDLMWRKEPATIGSYNKKNIAKKILTKIVMS